MGTKNVYTLYISKKKVRGVLVVKNCPPACIIFYFLFASVYYDIQSQSEHSISQYTTYLSLKEIILLHIQELKTKINY